ncbi:hypothetical protein HDV00_006447 [Rhizophlyctis rosea]|nr:hypothetical protein HDV00_006447 [Rhizophlyctis rosea]
MSTTTILKTLLIATIALSTIHAQVINGDATSTGRRNVAFNGNTVTNACTIPFEVNPETVPTIMPGRSAVLPSNSYYGVILGVDTHFGCFARWTVAQTVPRGYTCTISNCQNASPNGVTCNAHLHCTGPAGAGTTSRPRVPSGAPARPPSPPGFYGVVGVADVPVVIPVGGVEEAAADPSDASEPIVELVVV